MDFYRVALLVSGLFLGFYSVADAEPWEVFKPLLVKKSVNTTEVTHQKARMLTLDEQSINSILNFSSDGASTSRLSAKSSFQKKALTNSQKISLPLADGSIITVDIVPSYVLPEKLSEKFTNIKTYKVLPDERIVSGRLDITPLGFHAMIQTRAGDVFFIDPSDVSSGDIKNRTYVSYRKQDQKQSNETAYSCGAKNDSALGFSDYSTHNLSKRVANKTLDKSLLTYKIAIAATGEYVAKNGGTADGAMAAIVSTLNRVNQVFEHDLGIHLTLVENNDQLIYTDATSDPYNASSQKNLMAQNQVNIDRVIGRDNYDIGHLFTTSGGGLAAIASVCNEHRKGQGVSGISNPVNDSFNLDFVAHEIGHQLGATHTFNGVEGLCAGDTREGRTAFEPGSGSTIMSYAGYCGRDNLQSNTDPMFHIGSIEQIQGFTTVGKGNRCGIRREAQNNPPKVNAGKNYIIPANTPFELKGSAVDLDGDKLVYAWEQLDAGERSLSNDDKGDNALFRVHLPSSSTSRSFPPLNSLLKHTAMRGENLPLRERKLHFSFVVQDSFNIAQSDEMVVDVLRTGSRFALNLPRASYERGLTHKVLWNTADTELPPINCESVDVSLSIDGGYNFLQSLAKNVPNTGEAWVTIPADSVLTSQGRFKIECSDNVFFAVSYRNFVINKEGVSDILAMNDEDQPELELADKEISERGVRAVKEGGGGLDWFFFSFILMMFVRRRLGFLIT